MNSFAITVVDGYGDELYFSEIEKWVCELSDASLYNDKSDALTALFNADVLPGHIQNIGVLIPIDSENDIDLKTLKLASVSIIEREDIFNDIESELLEKIGNSDVITDTSTFINLMTTKLENALEADVADVESDEDDIELPELPEAECTDDFCQKCLAEKENE